MVIYESLITEGRQRPCRPSNSCCEEPCDEPSIWDLLPQCQLNWIAFGLATIAIGFALIGFGYINIGTSISGAIGFPSIPINNFNPTTLTQGTQLIAILLSIIIVSAWFFFIKRSNDWATVVVGSLLAAAGFPLAAIGAVYLTVSQIDNLPSPPLFDPTWFNIARNLLIVSVIAFLFLAYLIRASPCYSCIGAKRAIVVSLIFLGAGWATWSLGRLLTTIIITFQYSNTPPSEGAPVFTFPSAAFNASIFVSLINIALAVLLGWYILGCDVENCFTVFLPFFASVAAIGNWALYRVGLNVFSFVGGSSDVSPPLTASLIQFVYAIGFISISALILTFAIAICGTSAAVVTVSSAIPLLYAIAAYAYVAIIEESESESGSVELILQGIFQGITITVILNFFLLCVANCPIPTIIYGLASGTFGWAIIYLYSTSTVIIITNLLPTPDPTIINIGLNVIIVAAIIGFLYVQFLIRNELLSAIIFLNIALITVGAAGFTGIIAFYHAQITNSSDIRAAIIIYVAFVIAALFLPQYFAKCADPKHRLVITVASLAFGVTAVELGQTVALARIVAFTATYAVLDSIYPLFANLASAIFAVFAGQAIVWGYPQANIYTALIAIAIGILANGVAALANLLGNGAYEHSKSNIALIGEPWLLFTLALVVILIYLQFKSLCIQQSCRFLIGLVIPVFGIAIFGRTAGINAILGILHDALSSPLYYPYIFYINSRVMLVNSIIPLVGFFISLQAFKCTSCLAFLPSSITFTAVAYVASQSETWYFFSVLSTQNVMGVFPPFFNWITSVYNAFNFSSSPTPPTIDTILTNTKFVAQVGLTYILFLAPALIAGLVLSCSKPSSAVVLGAAIAATAISVGAFGISNVISGILYAITDGFAAADLITGPITSFITFANFIDGIGSQLALLAVGIFIVLFIYFHKRRCNSC